MKFSVELSEDEIREALAKKACEKLSLEGRFVASVSIDAFANGATRAVVTMEKK